MRTEGPSTFAECLALMARSVDCRLVCFRPQDVDVETGKVRGQVHDGWKWVGAIVDLPCVVDVTPDVLEQASAYEGVVELLKNRCVLTDDGGHVTNADLQEALAADSHFAPYALRTQKITSVRDVVSFVETNGASVVKPNVSGAGRVYLMQKADGGRIKVGEGETWETLDAAAFEERVAAIVCNADYVAQEYIASPSKLGDPFVCRVHAEKDGLNGWRVVRKYVRVGIGQCVSSNYADGGRSGCEAFIKACRPEVHESIVEAINLLAAEVPYKYENLRGCHVTSMGMDLSVGEDGAVRILSIDASPSTRHYHAEAARWRLGHYFWLLDYAVIRKTDLFAAREPWNNPADAHAKGFSRARFRKGIEARAKEKRPYIGILSNRIDAIGTCRIIAMLAAGRGMDVVFFLPKDVDMERGVINAYGLEGYDWRQKERPLPEVVNIASILYESTNKYADLIAYLRDRCYLTDDDSVRVNKEHMQMLLTDDAFFKRFSLETKHVANADAAVEFLEECPDAVIKPVGGMRGVGVYRIKHREDGIYEVGMYTDLQVLDREAFRAYVEKTFVNPRHIIQEYVSSRSKDGDPFDCRVHVEKNREGNWQLARAYIRVGIGQQIISNVNQGGNIVEAEPFLKMHRPNCWQEIMEGLDVLAATLPYKFENLKGRNLVSIGFDVGIDQNGGLHVFEVNTFPAIGFILAETALLKTGYYRWIYDHIIEGGEQFAPREPWNQEG